MFSALEIDRYSVVSDGLLVRSHLSSDSLVPGMVDTGVGGAAGGTSLTLPPKPTNTSLNSLSATASSVPPFSLSFEEDQRHAHPVYKLTVSPPGEEGLALTHTHIYQLKQHITYTLNPNRPHNELPSQVFELIVSQLKFISGAANKQLIESTAKLVVAACKYINIKNYT